MYEEEEEGGEPRARPRDCGPATAACATYPGVEDLFRRATFLRSSSASARARLTRRRRPPPRAPRPAAPRDVLCRGDSGPVSERSAILSLGLSVPMLLALGAFFM